MSEQVPWLTVPGLLSLMLGLQTVLSAGGGPPQVIRPRLIKSDALTKLRKVDSADKKARFPASASSAGRVKQVDALWLPSRLPVTRAGKGVGAGGGVPGTPCAECPAGDVECGGAVEGVLAVDDCQLFDGSVLDLWKLELTKAQEITARLSSSEFDTYILLLNDQCESVVENDDCTPGALDLSCVTAPLAPGTYYIAANGFSAQDLGAYSLEVACQDIAGCVDCVSGTISCNDLLSGELLDGDCDLPDGRLFDVYRFELPEGSRVSATMTSELFDTVLELLDADCLPIASNDDCFVGDFTRSCVVEDLEAGVYYLRMTSFESGALGSYDVSLECFDPCADCVVGSVGCGETVAGAFPASRCTEPGGFSLDLFALDLNEPQLVTIDLSSPDFDTFLVVLDSACALIDVNDDCGPLTFGQSCLDLELAAGRYFVGVSSFAPGESGEFTLDVRCPDISVCRDCTAGSLSRGNPVNGTLGGESCELEDGRAYDLWRLDVAGLDLIDLSLSASSASFEPVLAILDSRCNVLCDGDTTDCRALRQVVPGTYYVRVSGADAAATGDYELLADWTLWDPCTSCGSDSIACGMESAGRLEEGDCTLENGSFFDVWTLTLDRAQAVTVSMSSTELDTFVVLVDSDCLAVGLNDDCDPNTTDSCLTVDLAPGEYSVIANSFEPGAGDYRVSVSCTEISTCIDCSVSQIVCGEPVTGTLPASGCTFGDGTFLDLYELDLPAEGRVELQLTSTAFDTFLYLYDESCIPVAGNDDCDPGNFNVSCLFLDLPAGTYHVGVNNLFPDESGAYELTATCTLFEPAGSSRLPGDCNGDSTLNIADALCLLNELDGSFADGNAAIMCGGLPFSELPVADFDGQGGTTISDAISVLTYLFEDGPPHALGTQCVAVESCEGGCGT